MTALNKIRFDDFTQTITQGTEGTEFPGDNVSFTRSIGAGDGLPTDFNWYPTFNNTSWIDDNNHQYILGGIIGGIPPLGQGNGIVRAYNERFSGGGITITVPSGPQNGIVLNTSQYNLFPVYVKQISDDTFPAGLCVQFGIGTETGNTNSYGISLYSTSSIQDDTVTTFVTNFPAPVHSAANALTLAASYTWSNGLWVITATLQEAGYAGITGTFTGSISSPSSGIPYVENTTRIDAAIGSIQTYGAGFPAYLIAGTANTLTLATITPTSAATGNPHSWQWYQSGNSTNGFTAVAGAIAATSTVNPGTNQLQYFFAVYTDRNGATYQSNTVQGQTPWTAPFPTSGNIGFYGDLAFEGNSINACIDTLNSFYQPSTPQFLVSPGPVLATSLGQAFNPIEYIEEAPTSANLVPGQSYLTISFASALAGFLANGVEIVFVSAGLYDAQIAAGIPAASTLANLLLIANGFLSGGIKIVVLMGPRGINYQEQYYNNAFAEGSQAMLYALNSQLYTICNGANILLGPTDLLAYTNNFAGSAITDGVHPTNPARIIIGQKMAAQCILALQNQTTAYPVNQNTGGSNNLQAVNAAGQGIAGVTITILRLADYPNNQTNIQAQAITGPNGQWLAPAYVQHGTYVAVFTDPEFNTAVSAPFSI